MDFDREKLRGQRYDGCATMTGKKKGVATQIKNDAQTLALSTHCHTHLLNLACRDWIRNAAVVSKSLNTFTKLLNWSISPLNVIHIFKKSTKKSITRTKKMVAANLQH